VERDEEPLISIRAVTPADFAAIERLDLTYHTDRRLSIERSGSAPTHKLTFRWIERPGSQPVVYARPDSAWLASTLGRADLFLVAGAGGGSVVGYLIALTANAGDSPASDLAVEITDLAVDRSNTPLRCRARTGCRRCRLGSRPLLPLSLG
jgi:hypothetical protein